MYIFNTIQFTASDMNLPTINTSELNIFYENILIAD